MRSLFVFFSLGAVILFSQGTDLGTIRGTVTDPSGAVVPNAAVEVVDTATNIVRKLKTNSEGNYEASGLRSGAYKVAVTAAGFATSEIVDIALRPGGSVRADAGLKPKSGAELVVVTSEVPLVQTESPTITATLDNAALIALPRDSRDIYSFLYLNPNITQSSGDGGFKFLGAQSYGASFSLDGQRSNGGVFGAPTASQPSLETIGELTVQSYDFSAEYAGVANVRVTTRRGESLHHGSLFYNNKNSALAAWDLRDKIGQSAFLPSPALAKYPNPYFNLNEFGASFGGPLPKIKNTYFFAAYERRLQNSPVNLQRSNLPHPSLWVGDFSRMADNRKAQVPANVQLTAAEVANDTVGGQGQRFIRIPQRLLNPTTTAIIQKYFPPASTAAPINATNGRLVDFYTSLPGTIRRHLGTIRADHDFSERDKMYAVFNAQSNDQQTSAVVNPFVGLGLTVNERTNQTLSLSEIHLRGGFINEIRGGFNRQPTFRRSNQTLRDFLTNIGFNSADVDAYGAVIGASALDTYGHPAITFGTGFQNFTNGGRNTFRPLDQNLMTFGDTLTWIKRKHTFKFGADLVRNAALDGFTSGRGNPRGLITYTGAGPDAFARFLMGLPANSVSVVNKFRPPMDVHNWEAGFFAMDEYKIHPRVSLNLGIRYDLVTPFYEGNDLLVNFDPTGTGNNGRKGRFIVPSEATIAALDSRIINYGVVTADKAGLPKSLVRTDRNNLAPRVGLAWRITDRLVLRGGYGIFYPTSAAQGIRDPLATNGFQQGLTKSGAVTPLQGWPGATHGISPLTGGALNRITGVPAVNAVDPDLQQPRIQQFNITLERELGKRMAVRVSYLGTRMKGLTSITDLNMLPPSDKPFGTTTGDGVSACNPDDGDCDLSDADLSRRTFPLLGSYMGNLRNIGRGAANGLQIEVNRRQSSGLFFSASYTLLDQKTSAPDTDNSSLGGTVYNQFKPDVDYATDAFVSKHRFVAYGGYALPFGHGRKYGSQMNRGADAAIGGWEITWQLFAKSGYGVTPFWFCDNCDPVFPGNTGSDFIDATGGFTGTTWRPIVKGNGQVTRGDRIFDPSAFGPPPIGADVYDNPNVAKRNVLHGPSATGLNFGVHKVFRAGERIRADLGADFNNLLNHPLKLPNQDGAFGDFGNLGSFTVAVNPKTLQPSIADVIPNPNFGRLLTSYTQEGVDSRRTVRLKLRITF